MSEKGVYICNKDYLRTQLAEVIVDIDNMELEFSNAANKIADDVIKKYAILCAKRESLESRVEYINKRHRRIM